MGTKVADILAKYTSQAQLDKYADQNGFKEFLKEFETVKNELDTFLTEMQGELDTILEYMQGQFDAFMALIESQGYAPQSALDAHLAESATLSELGHVNHATLTATIPTTDWTGSSAPYNKEVTVTGMLATDNPVVDVDLSGAADYTAEQAILTAWGLVYRIVTGADKITVYAATVPETAIPIALKVVR